MKKNLVVLCKIFCFIFVLLQVACKNMKENFVSGNPGNDIESVRFCPEEAEQMPFNELFKSYGIINFQQIKERSSIFSYPVLRTDSLFIGANIFVENKRYLVYDTLGNLIRTIEKMESEDEKILSPYFYADNNQITSLWNNSWNILNLNGTIESKGEVNYSLVPSSFLKVNDSTWLFYKLHSMGDDTMRLWTTDESFILRNTILSYDKSIPNSGYGAFNKFIYQTVNSIYIADDLSDTIYEFSDSKIRPIYVFDFNGYNYKRFRDSEKPKPDEVIGLFTIVTDNVILRKVIMNGKTYLIYYNREEKISKTISFITDGPDLLNSAFLNNSDKYGRLYWRLTPMQKIDLSAYSKFPDFLELAKNPDKWGYFMIVSTLK